MTNIRSSSCNITLQSSSSSSRSALQVYRNTCSYSYVARQRTLQVHFSRSKYTAVKPAHRAHITLMIYNRNKEQSSSGSNTVCIKSNFSIVQTTLQATTYILFQLKWKVSLTMKTALSWIPSTDSQVRGTATYLFTYWGFYMRMDQVDNRYDMYLYVSY